MAAKIQKNVECPIILRKNDVIVPFDQITFFEVVGEILMQKCRKSAK